MTTIDFTVTFRAQNIPFVAWNTEAVIADVKQQLEAIVKVPVHAQKLIRKGKMLKNDQSLATSEIAPNDKIMLVGSTVKQLEEVARLDEKMAAREKIAAKPAKSYRAPASSSDYQYTFHRISVLDGFPQPDKARQMLERLRDDRGVSAIMKQRRWSVDELIELSPFETSILGYNRNGGQLIAIRLRTDDLTGFCHYNSVRKVLLHELTHNVWSDHDDNFHALNRQLNKDVINLDWTAHGGRRLGNEMYHQPNSAEPRTPNAGAHRLGGSAAATNAADRREQTAKAALARLTRQEEQEMDEGCGSRKDLK